MCTLVGNMDINPQLRWEGRRQGSGAVFWAKWKILDIKNLGGLYTSQNCLRTALLIGSGHGGCFNENGKF